MRNDKKYKYLIFRSITIVGVEIVHGRLESQWKYDHDGCESDRKADHGNLIRALQSIQWLQFFWSRRRKSSILSHAPCHRARWLAWWDPRRTRRYKNNSHSGYWWWWTAWWVIWWKCLFTASLRCLYLRWILARSWKQLEAQGFSQSKSPRHGTISYVGLGSQKARKDPSIATTLP